MGEWQGLRRAGQRSVSVCLWIVAAFVGASFVFAPLARADQHVFMFDASRVSPPPGRVCLAGDFNGWSTVATPMQIAGGRVYRISIDLTPGIHFYKFVCDGGRWFNDPQSDKPLEQPDGNGGINSAVLIGFDYRKLPPPRENEIDTQGLKHDPNNAEDCNVATSTLLRLAVHSQSGGLSSAEVFWTIGSAKWTSQALANVGGELGQQRWETLIVLPAAESHDPPTVHYYFALHNGTATDYLAAGDRIVPSASQAQDDADSALMKPTVITPDWAKHAVWYQIFPERFRNGDKANDPPGTVRWQSEWYEAQPGEAPGKENFYRGNGNIWKRRYGGDIQGIMEELPYLRGLGINAIYLNPIFEAESLHKYDTTDYRHVDEHFGFAGDYEALRGETGDPATWQWTKTDLLFLKFVAEAHRQGFKVILDGVFNHVGTANPYFQDVLKNRRRSKYAGWFDITDFGDNGGPLHYRAWDKNDGALPVWKKDNVTGLVHGPYEYVMGITRRWLAPDGDPSKGIDGFRLDVPTDVPHPFWIAWRKVVKETKPDAYTSGEIWNFAQAWLSKGDQFDATMDYPFATAMQAFFANQRLAISPTLMRDRCQEMIDAYPLQVSLVEMNLLDSHDTDRFASMIVNPDRGYNLEDRLQDDNPNYNISKPNATQRTRQRQAVAFQMTFLGAPMIYYGDEAGMWSASDPSNRQPMIWKDLQPYDDPQIKFDNRLFEHYRRLIAIRAAEPALQTGWFQTVKLDNATGLFAFQRTLGKQRVYVIISRNPEAQSIQIPIADVGPDEKLVNLLDPAAATVKTGSGSDARPTIHINDSAPGLFATGGELSVTAAPYDAMILVPQAAK
jgi:glycosidase